jgi:hypothetical protein
MPKTTNGPCRRIAEPDRGKRPFGNKIALARFRHGLWWLVRLHAVSSLRKCPYPILWFQHLGPVVVVVRGTSTHLIGQHSRATTKFVFLEIVFRLEAKIIKLKAGYGFFLCQCAKAFPANIIVLLAPPWKLFCYRAPIWLCDPPVPPMHHTFSRLKRHDQNRIVLAMRIHIIVCK